MKLFKVLNAIDIRDLGRFRHFIHSPLFNKRSDVKELFNIYLDSNRKPSPPKTYWTKIHPKQKFSVKGWNLLTSRLFKLLESYLALQEMRKSATQTKFHLAKVYRKLQQEKLFKEAIRDTARALEKQSFRNADYLQQKHDLSYEQYDYIISIDRKANTNLQEVSNHLDAYILTAKLRQACYALSREIVKQEVCKIGMLDEILLFVKENPQCLDVPGVAIYYYCYKAISSDENESYFALLRESIIAHQHLFPAPEIRDIYTLTINYAIRKLNTGSAIFIKEAFELYLLSLEQGYLLEDGIMLESTFGNIVSLASKLKKYKWAKTFVQENRLFLKPEFQKPMYHFSLGKLYYEQGQLENSLKELILVETKASFLFLGARVLQLKIYYELKEIGLLESLMESLRVYLQRSKNLAYRREHYNNILSFTRQLLQLPAMNKKERGAFRTKIEKAEIFSEKDWFLSKV